MLIQCILMHILLRNVFFMISRICQFVPLLLLWLITINKGLDCHNIQINQLVCMIIKELTKKYYVLLWQ